MELQLGLGLPGGSGNCNSSMINQLGFDLNSYFDDDDDHHQVFAAGCSSDSTTNLQPIMNVDEEIKLTSTRKRSFDEAFDHYPLENSTHAIPQTLPLLVWHHNNNLSDQDDNINGIHDDHDLDTTTCSSSIVIINECRNNIIEEYGDVDDDDDDQSDSRVIGWPPVKSSRKKQCRRRHHHKHGACHGHEYSKSSSMFVKVKMEGVGIARKVDLALHSSFHTLTITLMSMFGKNQEDVKFYNLAYQHKEGGWLVAGDVPWGSFIETVQRLKLLKKGG